MVSLTGSIKRLAQLLVVLGSCAFFLAGCGGGAGTSTLPAAPLAALPANTFAMASAEVFTAVLPATGTLSDQQVQASISADPLSATISVADTDGTVPYYAITADQSPSPGSPTGTSAVTVNLYSRLDRLAKVRLVITNSVLKSDGSFFMNGTLQILRPSTQSQVPDSTFQFTVKNEKDFMTQFEYSPDLYAVPKSSVQSLLAFAFLAATRPRT